MTITRPYQCGIAVYQLAKLRMLEFYYDFLDKFCDRRDFELIQMDTDSFYMALSANDFDEIIKPEMKELYFGDGAQLGSEAEKKSWLVTDEYSKRVPGLFKAEFQGKRMIALTSKCYFADNGDSGTKVKFSCKGVSRRQNKMNWERYKNALFGSLDKARNIGFRKRDNHQNWVYQRITTKELFTKMEFIQVVFKKKNVFQRNPLRYKKKHYHSETSPSSPNRVFSKITLFVHYFLHKNFFCDTNNTFGFANKNICN